MALITGNEVTLKWVAAYKGVADNEKIDRFAVKESQSSITIGCFINP